MKKYPKILFVWTKNAGVTWYRVIQFADAMCRVGGLKLGEDIFYPPWNANNQLGHQWEMEMGQDLKRASEFFAPLISDADLVIFQTFASQLGFSIFASCKDLGKKVLTTIDDMEQYVPYGHAAFAGNQPGARPDHWLQIQLQSSHAVICSTKYLADQIMPINPNCYVIPNAINFDLWDNVKKIRKSNGAPVRIGWAGGASHEPDLAIIEEPCMKIREKYKDRVEFWFIGGPPMWAFNKDGFTCKRSIDPGGWANIDQYHHFMGSLQFDIGLAPLRDNVFNRAKSNLRWLEYSALKIPTIASSVEAFYGPHKIRRCSEESHWYEVMDGWIKFKQDRHFLGKAAYEECKKKYNIKTVAKEFLNVISEVYHGTTISA